MPANNAHNAWVESPPAQDDRENTGLGQIHIEVKRYSLEAIGEVMALDPE